MVTRNSHLKSSPMSRRAVALKAMVRKHRPKREDLDPRKWMKGETVRGFADFILHQHSDRDTDDSFDNREMCEYVRMRNCGKEIDTDFTEQKTTT